jgi:Skp family chaperone for outer membrane proteins
MRPFERLFIYTALTLIAAAGAFTHVTRLSSVAHASPRGGLEPSPARLAMCDVYEVTDKLMNAETMKTTLEAERDRIRVEVEPMEKELKEMRDKLQAMSPQDEAAQAMFRDFQKKQQDYSAVRQKLETEFESFVARKYIESYDQVRASVEAVAEDLGFTHVISSRRKDSKIDTNDVQRVIEAVLARPMIKIPDGADITEDVIKDLKLQ